MKIQKKITLNLTLVHLIITVTEKNIINLQLFCIPIHDII